jgi:hypothetical protein
VASDIDAIEGELADISGASVVALRLAGNVGMADQRRIQRLLDVAQGRARALEADLADLRLQPTDADIAALAADGYLDEVLVALRGACGAEADDGVAAEALRIMAGMLLERQV